MLCGGRAEDPRGRRPVVRSWGELSSRSISHSCMLLTVIWAAQGGLTDKQSVRFVVLYHHSHSRPLTLTRDAVRIKVSMVPLPRDPPYPPLYVLPGRNNKVPPALAHKAGSHVQRNYSGSFRRWQAFQGRSDSPKNQILTRSCLLGADAMIPILLPCCEMSRFGTVPDLILTFPG